MTPRGKAADVFPPPPAVGLDGVELIRTAMRKAARQLGWKVTTIGMIGTRHGTMLVVSDTAVPEDYRAVVDAG
ncbi:hypothetical protein OG239_43330 (plasmid) [Streptomyces sp. NBC_00868]|uniref:hypothetical protein n=1 Tax=Streptomyces sp. NBC_00868 TaxID=2903683 RepID=UPI00386E288E|nr:hypothetical protein OG239_43330 [Streptomyces sp. NBC_00868]